MTSDSFEYQTKPIFFVLTMSYAIAIVLYLCFAFKCNSECVSPEGSSGKSLLTPILLLVDYWFVYKLPNSTYSNFRYLYFDSSMNSSTEVLLVVNELIPR